MKRDKSAAFCLDVHSCVELGLVLTQCPPPCISYCWPVHRGSNPFPLWPQARLTHARLSQWRNTIKTIKKKNSSVCHLLQSSFIRLWRGMTPMAAVPKSARSPWEQTVLFERQCPGTCANGTRLDWNRQQRRTSSKHMMSLSGQFHTEVVCIWNFLIRSLTILTKCCFEL